MKITAIIPAAGSGNRYSKTKNKLLENLNGIPVIINTLKIISSVNEINEIIICTSTDLINEINNLVNFYNISSKVTKIIIGGETRQQSVFNALKSIETNPDLVLIHDGARPLISKEIIGNAINSAIEKRNLIVAVPTKDTIKRINKLNNQVIETPDRNTLWNIQTPQIFDYTILLEGHRKFASENFTDDAAIIEKMGFPVYTEMGSYKNIKITTPEDLQIAEILSQIK